MIPVLRAELTKALTLRAIQGTLLTALLIPPALAFASGLAFDPPAPASAATLAPSPGFATAGFGQPLVILLAALITGTEYLDGQLRSTLLAAPGRGRLLTAKLVIVGALAGLIGAIATAMAVLAGRAALGEGGLEEGGLAPAPVTAAMAWNLLGVVVNYVLIALIAAAITVLARTLIVTLVVLVPLVLGLTISLLGIVPPLKYLPDLAGIQLLTDYPGMGLLEPITGGVVMALWAAGFTLAAAVVFRLRDCG